MAQVVTKPLTPRGRFWKTHVEQWQATSVTQIQYCKEQDISLSAFRWWRRRLGLCNESPSARGELTIPNSAGTFTEVSVPMLHEASSGYAYEILLPNQIKLRVKSHFAPEAVTVLLAILERAC